MWTVLLTAFPAFIFSLALPGIILAFRHYLPEENNISVLLILAGVILSLSGLLTLWFLFKRNLNSSITALSAGILLAIFTGGFAVPKYNHLIGPGNLCKKALERTGSSDSSNFYYCKGFRGANLDVYLGKELRILEIKDLYAPEGTIETPAVIFIGNKTVGRNDSLKVYLEGKNVYRSGSYSFVEIE